MPNHTKHHEDQSPLAILTELAVEATSSLVEAQRTFLNLAQQENDIICNGVKERVGGFMPAFAATGLVQRSLDTLIGMQEELLTTTSKQTLQWLQSEHGEKSDRAAQLVDFAREGMETFARAQKKFIEAVAQETATATGDRKPHDGTATKSTELAHLACEAGNAFVEAQKRLLDVIGQQMNVNLDAATRTMELMTPSQLLPLASRGGASVKNFFDAETSLISSLVKPHKKKDVVRAKHGRAHATRRSKAVPV